MRGLIRNWLVTFIAVLALPALAQPVQQVVDIPSRPGVTQRMLVLTPPRPRAAVILLAGGHGGLQLQADGSMNWGKGNFLVRTRNIFARQGLTVAVIDAPSDRQGTPFLSGFRHTPEHAADIKAAMQAAVLLMVHHQYRNAHLVQWHAWYRVPKILGEDG